jgi:solute carrier family 45 protein 1/2/4
MNTLLIMLTWWSLCAFSSTWVSGLYNQEHPEAKTSGNWAEGTRAGSFALLIYAIVAMVAGFVFPWLTTRRYLSMKNVYTGSHLIYGVTMVTSYWIQSVVGATVAIGIVGISWACSMWIPFALVGEYLYNENNKKNTTNGANSVPPAGADDDLQETKSISSSMSETEKSVVPPNDSGTVIIEIKSLETQSEPIKSELENTGMALGVVNIFVVLPQFLVALIAALIFMIRQKYVDQAVSSDQAAIPTGDNDVVGVAWVLEFGSWMAFVAALLSRRVIEV